MELLKHVYLHPNLLYSANGINGVIMQINQIGIIL